MKPLRDLSDQTFYRLTVIGPSYIENGIRYWPTVCECGETRQVRHSSLLGGNVKACVKCARESAGSGLKLREEARDPRADFPEIIYPTPKPESSPVTYFSSLIGLGMRKPKNNLRGWSTMKAGCSITSAHSQIVVGPLEASELQG